MTAHHGGQDRQEERSGGHVTGALSEGGYQQAEDYRRGRWRYVLQRGQFVPQPLRQTRFLMAEGGDIYEAEQLRVPRSWPRPHLHGLQVRQF